MGQFYESNSGEKSIFAVTATWDAATKDTRVSFLCATVIGDDTPRSYEMSGSGGVHPVSVAFCCVFCMPFVWPLLFIIHTRNFGMVRRKLCRTLSEARREITTRLVLCLLPELSRKTAM